MWPTVTWQGTKLVVFYLSELDEVNIKETAEIDFNDFFLHLDRGGSIFITVKPTDLNTEDLFFEQIAIDQIDRQSTKDNLRSGHR